jgi:hypothetical protein
MRYAIAPVVGIAIGFSLKATFFPPTAVADKLHDMSFVFSQPN